MKQCMQIRYEGVLQVAPGALPVNLCASELSAQRWLVVRHTRHRAHCADTSDPGATHFALVRPLVIQEGRRKVSEHTVVCCFFF